MKRALVRTVGDAQHARSVCFSFLETRPQPTQSVRRPHDVLGTLEHASGGMGDIVKARAAQTVVL